MQDGREASREEEYFGSTRSAMTVIGGLPRLRPLTEVLAASLILTSLESNMYL